MAVLVGGSLLVSPATHASSSDRILAKSFALQSGAQPDFQIQITSTQFLVKNGSSTETSIIVYPISGFIGNVSLRATISPIQSSPPTVSFNPSIVRLNASSFESTSNLLVTTANSTELGLYNITVMGSSGLLTHSAIATVGVADHFVPSNGVELVYKADFATNAYIGGSTILESTFEDLGDSRIGISNLSVSLDFGHFQYPNSNTTRLFSYFLTIEPYKQSAFGLTIHIPSSTPPGQYQFTVIINWVLSPGFLDQAAPQLAAHGNIVVYSSPLNATSVRKNDLVKLLTPVLASVGAAVLLAIGLVLWNGKRSEKRNQAMLPWIASIRQTQKTCASCGSPTPVDAKFCGRCGHPI
jgi:hypothetical protein